VSEENLFVLLLTLELLVPDARSLKEKRGPMKGLKERVRSRFNVSIAEVENQDLWQSAILGVACVSNGAGYVHRLLTKVVEWIERYRPDVQVVDYQIEIF